MKIGKFEFLFGKKKSYRDLEDIITRSKGTTIDSSKSIPYAQLSEYQSWQYDCVSLISDKISSVPFSFYNKRTGEEINSKNHNYKFFSKPFLQPNDLMSFRFIKAWCQIQLDLCGMAMIYKARNQLGQVWELWPLNMNDLINIQINYNRTNKLLPETYYNFSIDGNNYQFTVDDVIFLMYPHPKYLDRGASPIQAQAYNVDIEHYIEIYERDFFANSARVDMILKTEQDLDEDTAKRVKETWRSSFRGNFHDIVVLGSNLQPVPMKWTNKDFEFLNLSKWSRDKILSAYKIPPSKLGITESSNRSGGVNADNNYHQDCIQPRLNLWDEECTKEIISAIDPNVVMKHDNPLPRDRQIEVTESRVYLSGVPCLTINEVRKNKGLKAVNEGDRIYIPSGFIPLDRLDEYIDNQLTKNTSNSTNNQVTDPNRHVDDTPHLNPDGSDNRDTTNTDGRSLEYFEIKINDLWQEYFKSSLYLCKNYDDIEKLLYNLLYTTVKYYLKFYNKEDLLEKNDSWIKTYVKDISKNFWESGFSKEIEVKTDTWENFCKNQLEVNSRIVKICFVASQSCINYAKFLYAQNMGLDYNWKINKNFCVHKHKIIKNSNKTFNIGNKFLRFPGEYLNLNCDCTLELKDIL